MSEGRAPRLLVGMATPSEARAQYRIDALPEHAGRVVVVAPSVLALLGATLCDFVWLSTAEARSLAKLAVAPRRAAGSGPSDVAVAVGRAVIDELMAVAGVMAREGREASSSASRSAFCASGRGQ